MILVNDNIAFYVLTEPLKKGEEILVDYGGTYDPERGGNEVIRNAKIEEAIDEVLNDTDALAETMEESLVVIDEERVLEYFAIHWESSKDLEQICDELIEQGVFGNAYPKDRQKMLHATKLLIERYES